MSRNAVITPNRTRASAFSWLAGSLLWLGALSSAATGCKPRSAEAGADSGFSRTQTVFVGGRQWGEPSSFNPLSGSPDWPTMNGMGLLFETLFLFNQLDGKLHPVLGESYAVRDDEVEVVLNPAARWNDGKPVTGWDVKYTFDLGQTYKGLLTASIWNYITEIRLPEADSALPAGAYPRKIVFKLNEKNNRLVVLDQIVERRIVPRHVIEPLLSQVKGNIDEFLKLKFDKNPVGSGPYKLHSYTSEKIVAVRDDNYWGNKALFNGKLPAPKYVIHPIYKSNDHFSVALQQGRLTASSSFVPRIWRKFEKGVRTWYDDVPYFVPTSIPMLWLNVTEKPLDDVKYRRAMAFSIQYDDIRELAASGYSEPLRPGLILPFGLEKKYYSEEDAKKYGTYFDPERAKAELKAGGYTPVWGDDGELLETRDRTGKRVRTVYIKSPTGWSDWEAIVRIAVRGMRSVGIDARERFVDASLFWTALYGGDFDLIMYTPASSPLPSTPWSRFEWVLTSNDWSPPRAEKMYKNMGRFNNPKSPTYLPRVDELLNTIPKLTDEAELMAAYREINRLYMELQPTLPLVYRPDQFYEFSTKYWTNFPTAANPYLPPQLPGDRLGTHILWHLKPAQNN
ncbi:MAG TPA: ABC transporter substrate-binding protein [Polyangiaceae bacterium]